MSPDMAFLRETGEPSAETLLELVVMIEGHVHVLPIDRTKALIFNQRIALALTSENERERGGE